MIDYDIDLVVPFVDNNEEVGRKTFINYCEAHNLQDRIKELNGERFADRGLFKYGFKCVYKFMPGIRKIHLIVSNIEQVPSYAQCDKLHVVLHKDIIPEQYLPVFNSSTIEMFIANIPGLAEHFIYSNDDMFPVRPLQKEDFYTNDDRIRMLMCHRPYGKSIFDHLCSNAYCTGGQYFNVQLSRYTVTYPEHTMSPFKVSECKKCLEILGDKAYENVSAFRNEKEFNQYVYMMYMYFQGKIVTAPYRFMYTDMGHKSLDIVKNIRGGPYKFICINDAHLGEEKQFSFKDIEDAFKAIL